VSHQRKTVEYLERTPLSLMSSTVFRSAWFWRTRLLVSLRNSRCILFLLCSRVMGPHGEASHPSSRIRSQLRLFAEALRTEQRRALSPRNSLCFLPKNHLASVRSSLSTVSNPLLATDAIINQIGGRGSPKFAEGRYNSVEHSSGNVEHAWKKVSKMSQIRG